MIYFRYLPQEFYDGTKATNIMCRAKIMEVVKKNSYLYYPYVIRDGERPDIIAHKYYGNAGYAWLLFFANDINDPIFDWPLTERELMEYIRDKYTAYSASNPVAWAKRNTHHYIDQNGYIVDEITIRTDLTIVPTAVSYFDYEVELNEARRNINIIDSRYVAQIYNELRDMFNK